MEFFEFWDEFEKKLGNKDTLELSQEIWDTAKADGKDVFCPYCKHKENRNLVLTSSASPDTYTCSSCSKQFKFDIQIEYLFNTEKVGE